MEAACTRRVLSSWATLRSSVSGQGLRRAKCQQSVIPCRRIGRQVSGSSSTSPLPIKERLPGGGQCGFFRPLSSDFSRVCPDRLGSRAPRQPARTLRVAADMQNASKALVGEDFGARDPTVEELGSNFGSQILGNADTEHVILIPDVSNIVGLSTKSCQPLPRGTKPMAFEEARPMLRKIVGWKIVDKDGVLHIQASWEAKNFKAGLELFRRVAEIAESENHHPDLHLEAYNKVTIEIYTHSVGGLSINDFILAAKIDTIDVKDLLKKNKKFWA